MVISFFYGVNEMDSSKYIFPSNKIMEIAVFFRKSPSSIRKSLNDKVYTLTYKEDAKYLLMQGYKNHENAFYYRDEKSAIYVRYLENYLYLQVYLIAENRIFEMEQVKTFYKNMNNINDSIYHHLRRIEEAEREIISLVKTIGTYEPVDYNAIAKIAKQMKMPFEIKGDLFEFQLGRVSCGDERSGYINYKNVIIYVTDTMQLEGIKFQFKNWEYDTRWGFMNTIHPHVNGNHLCTGNRQDDMTTYKIHKDWGFMLATYKECFSSYYPDSSYSKIRDIVGVIRFMNKNSSEIEYPSNITSDEAKSKWYYNQVTQSAKRCRRCNNTYYGDECDIEDCVGNPNTIKLCKECNTQMVWNAHSHKIVCPTCYECRHCGVLTPNSTVCGNIECAESPNYQPCCSESNCNGRIVDGNCINEDCVNSLSYKTGLWRYKEQKVCFICGKELLLSSDRSLLYCPNHGAVRIIIGNNKPLYSSYLHTINRALENRQDYLNSHNNNIPCPKCVTTAVYNAETNELVCPNHGKVGHIGEIQLPNENGTLITIKKVIWEGEVQYGEERENLNS